MTTRDTRSAMEAALRHLVLGLAAGLLMLGAGSVKAQGTLTLRDRLVIVNSSSSAGLGQILARGFTERHQGVAPPLAQTLGSVRAMEAFCSGVGPQTPDILLVTRRLPRAVLESCTANGVRDIVELQLGLGSAVLVARRGEAMPALTSRQDSGPMSARGCPARRSACCCRPPAPARARCSMT
jgi:phosphate transport system substrate-binding protein